jgi:hypothetical protein
MGNLPPAILGGRGRSGKIFFGFRKGERGIAVFTL